ncbi:hypothetical protein GQ55_2G307300 [Panicum hallii var. hallii]|uniref:Uncharacterized protein n=2 Tax=Panicum hallii TaxID=206008 RepID=A0A2T7EU52_9POAL|nr:hypothetical protein GQ55_2G307300 [Panicum hallii var. hallii]PVH64631.1 hypothetical protein PAHAL_2G318700 [Panicum hallii]
MGWKTALCSCIVSLKLMLVGVSSLLTDSSSLSCWSQQEMHVLAGSFAFRCS